MGRGKRRLHIQKDCMGREGRRGYNMDGGRGKEYYKGRRRGRLDRTRL
jgi:hypothetical protein